MRIPGLNKPSTEESDWVTQATKTITGFVDGLHDAAVVPLTTIARAIVFGVLVFTALITTLVLLAIGLVRFADVYLHNIPNSPDGVWLTYLVVGAIFMLAGLFVFSKRNASQ